MVVLSARTLVEPLLLLEDLIVALRAIDGARMGGMRCSIDPTLGRCGSTAEGF